MKLTRALRLSMISFALPLGMFMMWTCRATVPSLPPRENGILEPLPIEQALDFREPLPYPRLSPDERQLAYGIYPSKGIPTYSGRTFSASGTPGFATTTEVWVTNLSTGEARNLGRGRQAAWSPDGKRLAFYSDRDGKEGLWLWEVASDTTRRLSSAVGRYYNSVRQLGSWCAIQWTSDGKYILAKLLPQDMSLEEAQDFVLTPSEPGERLAVGSTVTAYRPSGSKLTATAMNHRVKVHLGDIAFIDVATGHVKRIAQRVLSHRYDLSPDGAYVAISDLNLKGPRVLLYSVAQDSLRTFASDLQQDFVSRALSWSPDSKALAYQAGDKWVVVSVDTKRFPAHGDAATLSSRPPWEAEPDEGDQLFKLRLPPSAAAKPGTATVHRLEETYRPADLWLEKPGNPQLQRLTRLNPLYEKHDLGQLRIIEWLSDGVRRRGAVMLPAGYEPDKRYPLVTWVYGSHELSKSIGEFGGDKRELFLLTTRGYAVLYPDSSVATGTLMIDIARNVLPGVDAAVAAGFADSQRLGVIGHSFGGYSTLALIVQSKRFKAAVASAGLYNLTSYYGSRMDKSGVSEGERLAEERLGLGGSPWEYRERYIENSPFFYLDRVQTPLLLLHGDRDPVVASQSDEVYIGLRSLGRAVEYAKYADEGHSINYFPNQVDYWTRVIEWFERHLRS